MHTGNARALSSLRSSLGFAAQQALRYRLDLAGARLAHQICAAPVPIRVLLVSDGAEYTSEQQFAPFRRYRAELRSRLGVVTKHMLDSRLHGRAALRAARFDLIVLKLGFRTTPGRALERTRQLAARSGNARLVYFDGDDDAGILWPALLEHVDLYVKKQVFSDPAHYQRVFVGKSNLTDYVHRSQGTSFADDIIPSAGPVDAALTSKIHLGFNVACDDKIVDAFGKSRSWRDLERNNDIICRAAVPSENWIRDLRLPVLERLTAMATRARVLTPSQRVPQDLYYEEMRSSRICVSPFGYGEICWRDFEAILCRCLLLKPDMSHLRTEPDIFRPFETYVPIRWDYGDLEEKCLYYLQNESERKAIVERAHRVLSDYYQSCRVVEQLGRILQRLGWNQIDPKTRLAPDTSKILR